MVEHDSPYVHSPFLPKQRYTMKQIELPKEVNLRTLEEAGNLFQLLILKIKELESRAIARDTGLVEEIIHLRKETHEGLQALKEETQQGFQTVNDQLDELTLSNKAQTQIIDRHTEILRTHSTILSTHTELLQSHATILNEHTGLLKSHSTIMLQVVDKLDEISKKLDK